MAAATRGSTTIRGFVVALPQENDDDSDADESDDDADWLDFGEMSAMADGASYIKFTAAKKRRVTIKSVTQPKREYFCQGLFQLMDPWWLITAQAKYRQRCYYMNGHPEYELREDSAVTSHKLVVQFLTSAGRTRDNMSDPVVDDLIDYFEANGIDKRLQFKDLEEEIEKYLQTLGEADLVFVKKTLNSTIWLSGQGSVIQFATRYPKLFKVASQLLPCHFLKLAEKACHINEKKLQLLEEATETKLWVFGFKQILYREFGVMGLEAQLRSWVNSRLIHRIPAVQRDALYMYNALKLYAKKRGHTYVKENELRNKSATFFEKHVVQNWEEALAFLDKNAVIILEIEADHVKIFLKTIWYAERDTAKALTAVLENGSGDPLEMDVDLSSDDFDSTRTDRDQWTAVHLMVNSPITVLSGKGGCGKTSVVTKLLSHACVRSGKAPKPDTEPKEEDQNTSRTPSKLDRTRHMSGIGDATFTTTQTESEAMTKDGNQDEADTYLSKTVLGQKVLLTAPTGKAANLLGRKAQLKSCTLHSVIMSFKMFCIRKNEKKAKGEGGEESTWTHADKEMLVVDECSLVSVGTFATVLNILLKECHLKKIILLGDVRQLPSIEPGNFLGDIFTVLAPLGFSIELQTNHRAESELIVQNATRIAAQKNPVFDASRRFHLLQPEEEDQQGRDTIVRTLLTRSKDLQDPITSQFVAFTRRDCEAVNELCCRHYNKHLLKAHTGKLDFQPGDKVCMTRNGTVSHHFKKIKPKKKTEEENADKAEGEDASPGPHNLERGQTTSVKRNLNMQLEGITARQDGRHDGYGVGKMERLNEYDICDNNKPGSRYTALKSRENNQDRSHVEDLGEGEDILNSSLETSAASQTYMEALDDLINAAGREDSQLEDSTFLSDDDGDDLDTQTGRSSRLRTDASGFLEMFHGDTRKGVDVIAGKPVTNHVSDKNVTLSQNRSSSTIGRQLAPQGGDNSVSTHQPGGDNSIYVPPAGVPEAHTEEEIDGSTPQESISKRDVKLCNGEIFYVEKELSIFDNRNKASRYIFLCDRDEERPRRVCANYKQLMKSCKMKHAWVRTIHTFQGSESQSVVYILSPNNFYENWQHVYTAITRGRQSVYVVGSPATLNTIIVRKVFPRQTTLQVKLQDHLRPREKIVQSCVRNIADSLRGHQEMTAKGDNPLSPSDGERSLFDSDDSWVCQVNDSFGLSLDQSDMAYSTEPPLEQGNVTPSKCHGSSLPLEVRPSTSGQEMDSLKRRQNDNTAEFMSPPKCKKASDEQLAVTPVRSSLSSLTL
ncbi:DNA helicase B-like [Haliotis rufescens]|uniref:DNA helicase B-like n=1 Tax=Haliotis rufescens TaxID=6454 RepID=UPI00201FABA6|nr:DNA helicase B-like [Haliotis rufescens]